MKIEIKLLLVIIIVIFTAIMLITSKWLIGWLCVPLAIIGLLIKDNCEGENN